MLVYSSSFCLLLFSYVVVYNGQETCFKCVSLYTENQGGGLKEFPIALYDINWVKLWLRGLPVVRA